MVGTLVEETLTDHAKVPEDLVRTKSLWSSIFYGRRQRRRRPLLVIVSSCRNRMKKKKKVGLGSAAIPSWFQVRFDLTHFRSPSARPVQVGSSPG